MSSIRIFLKSTCLAAATLGAALLTAGPSQAQSRCSTAELAKKESAIRRAYMPGGKFFEKQIREARKATQVAEDDTSIYNVPVVVHIIHKGESVGQGTNLSDDVVKEQIKSINEDYRRMAGTNGFNTNPAGADTRIEFYLATCDSNGNYSTGITRELGSTTLYSLGDDSTIKTPNLWPVERYLNIWVCDLETNFLGYSTFPVVQGIPLNSGTSNLIDGVVIDYNVFGKHNQTNNFNLGRTVTHEIGHYLGLIHVWGDQGSCTGDDYCLDTPIQEGEIDFCPTAVNTCPGQARPMIENYMQYTYDRCMNVFTADQTYRMRYVLRNSSRHILKDSSRSCTTPTVLVERASVFAYYSAERSSIVLEDNSIDSTSPAHLKLYSIEGKLLLELTSMERSFAVPKVMATGLYLLHFERGNTHSVMKIVPFNSALN